MLVEIGKGILEEVMEVGLKFLSHVEDLCYELYNARRGTNS